MTKPREQAIEAALRRLRRHESDGFVEDRDDSALKALEDELGSLDWSMDGDGFRLAREVADRAFGPEPRRSFRRPGVDRYYDVHETGRARKARRTGRGED